MYLFAELILVAAFLFAVSAAGAILIQPSGRQARILPWAERCQFLITALLSLCSLLLVAAFINYDFSLEYVASYSDLTLPMFYRITAFWAGQSGSMLFWAWSVALGGAFFIAMPAYKRLSVPTKLWFWVFFLGIMAFFLLILTAWNNPFTKLPQPYPVDGAGLNPLLQNPGMIFHPPLLFLGYGGFTVPACLALGQTLSGRLNDPLGYPATPREEETWGMASRPFILVAWVLLTAGIVLGAWWAYMELGWGGYWAWDPVENASLIPWLVATAYLHTGVIESRRGKLRSANVMLMSMTTISAFFATYLVRSGVVDSLHAFGKHPVGAPLLIFTLCSLVLVAVIVLCVPRKDARPLGELTSREGMLVMVSWLFMALCFIILVATMWPVIASGLKSLAAFFPESLGRLLPAKPTGLKADFYNRTCLPLFALLGVLLVVCPYRKWKTPLPGFLSPKILIALGICAALVAARLAEVAMGPIPLLVMLNEFVPLVVILAMAVLFFPMGSDVNVTNPAILRVVLLVMVLTAGLTFLLGFRQPIALIAASCSFAALVGIILLFIINPSLAKIKPTLAAHGVHIGLLLMLVGVAFSGPYQVEAEFMLGKGQRASVGKYAFHLKELYTGENYEHRKDTPNYSFLEAEVEVYRDGKLVGVLEPQSRLYAKFERRPFSEVSTLFSLGTEVYATLLGLDDSGRASLVIHINPLVNWLWIGCTIMCLFPFIGLGGVKRLKEGAETADNREEAPSADEEST